MNQLEGSLFEGFWIKCGVVVSGAFQPKYSEYVFSFWQKNVFSSFKTRSLILLFYIFWITPPAEKKQWQMKVYRLRFYTKIQVTLAGILGVWGFRSNMSSHLFAHLGDIPGPWDVLLEVIGSICLGSVGYFTCLLNGVYWDEFSPTDPKQMDPNFLGHA